MTFSASDFDDDTKSFLSKFRRLYLLYALSILWNKWCLGFKEIKSLTSSKNVNTHVAICFIVFVEV